MLLNLQLDSAASALCDGVDGHLDGLLDTIDAMQPDDLLACLDSLAAAGDSATSGGGSVAAVAAEGNSAVV